MIVAVIGGGGREHAICDAFAKSPKVSKLYCLPGNAGIADIAECINIKVMDFDSIVNFVLQNAVDLVFVAPDDPLAAGLVNRLESEGIRAFGPHAEAAIIEGSKAFSKEFMKRNNIPTASYETFNDFDKALEYVKTCNLPIVIKADGLALGKGVIIAESYDDAQKALFDMMKQGKFGSSGNTVVIEEFMVGKECTLLAFTDGKTVKCMPSSQDHKRAYDNDKGLNTGGMGVFSPSKAFTQKHYEYALENIVYPTINALDIEGRKFKGVLYFGLMVIGDKVKVVEYNARFGDPETQTILPLLKTDFLDVVNAVIDEKLDEINIEWENKASVCVILASGGYPENYIKGYPISIGDVDCKIFHSGTAIKDGLLVTNGGRVLCVVATADSIDEARSIAYDNVKKISFNNMHYRTDIGIKL